MPNPPVQPIPAVHHDAAHVRAVLDDPQVPEPKGPERHRPDPGAPQPIVVARRQCRAERVVEHPDRDAGSGPLRQNRRQRVGHSSRTEVIHLNRDRAPGGPQVGPETGERAVPVQCQLDTVAGHDRRPGEQGDGERERRLRGRHWRAVGPDPAHPVHGRAPGDEEQADGRGDDEHAQGQPPKRAAAVAPHRSQATGAEPLHHGTAVHAGGSCDTPPRTTIGARGERLTDLVSGWRSVHLGQGR